MHLAMDELTKDAFNTDSYVVLINFEHIIIPHLDDWMCKNKHWVFY